MSRREEWRKVLDSEVLRWSAMSYEQILAALADQDAYEVEFDSKKFQVEVQVFDAGDGQVHVMVGVDDGSLPASIFPSTQTFVCHRTVPNS